MTRGEWRQRKLRRRLRRVDGITAIGTLMFGVGFAGFFIFGSLLDSNLFPVAYIAVLASLILMGVGGKLAKGVIDE